VTETASILAVGSELLGTTRLDTNSLFLTGELEAIGVRVVRKACVVDGWEELLAELRFALERSPLLVVTGGLGPTEDDRTKEAVAHLLGRRLLRDEEILASPEGAVPEARLRDARGEREAGRRDRGGVRPLEPSGDGARLRRRGRGRTIVLLPGVPNEMKALFVEAVVPRLTGGAPREGLHRRILKVAGLGESMVEQLVKPVYETHREHDVTILAAAPGEVQLHFAARGGREEAGRTLDVLEAAFAPRSEGPSSAGTRRRSRVVGRLLREAGRTLALAESCTGGMIAARLTDVAGASDVFPGGVVAYANEAKVALLGFARFDRALRGRLRGGRREMAAGARRRFGASAGLAVTGVAGPSGGTPEKPVGTVHLALDAESGSRHERLTLAGDRAMIRRWTTSAALGMVRAWLNDGGGAK
jgi:competence/damage-inducible protein CinA C-terminal domain